MRTRTRGEGDEGKRGVIHVFASTFYNFSPLSREQMTSEPFRIVSPCSRILLGSAVVNVAGPRRLRDHRGCEWG